jgi:glycosyltransferase involved in cell wall biosynthesis
VDFHKDFEEEGRDEFFKKISILSVPVLEGEAFGLYLIEAMASGVPVVQPALGAFPEIIEKAGGGVVYQSNTPAQLASTLADLLSDPAKLAELCKTGREGIERKFNIHQQASEIIEFYKKIKNQISLDSDAA